MNAKTKYGVRMGDKTELAVRLAARPQGATMGEIRSHTDQNHYNIFKRLEEVGHTVVRKGQGSSMRIWLSHKDDEGADIIDADELLDAPFDKLINDDGESAELSFSLERDLQLALRSNLDQLEKGLKEADGGSEENFRDITAIDTNGNIVVIELKAIKAGKDAVAQLLAYMGEVASSRKLRNDKVRGILVAPSFQEKALSAASMVPNIALKTYRASFSFRDVS